MPKPKHFRAIADCYDAEYANYRILEEDVPFFMGQLPKKRQRILEIAVGTGRAAIPLAQAGHHVTGIDFAQDMIDIAIHKRDAVGLSQKELTLKCADAMNFDLGQRFDWVCVFFNTFLIFSTLEQQDRVMKNILRHLAPKGRLWIDVFQPDLRLISEPVRAELDPTLFFVPEWGRTVLKTTEIHQGKSSQLQHVTFNYEWFENDGTARAQQVKFDMTYLFPREIQMLMERHGLQVEGMWGNYDGSNVTPDSPRIIVRCCRQ